MRAMFLLCWLAIGLAFGGVETPVAAHDLSPVGAAGMVDEQVLHGETAHADSTHQDHAPDGDEPCHGMVQHHHCHIGIGMDAHVAFAALDPDRAHIRPGAGAHLSSLAQAPPLQPPSA